MRASGDLRRRPFLLLLLLPSGSFSTRVALPSLAELPAGAKLVAGVPVYEYSLLFPSGQGQVQGQAAQVQAQAQAQAQQDTQQDSQQDSPPDPPQARALIDLCDADEEELQRLCRDHPKQIGLCGHGVHYAEFHGTEQDLEQFISDAGGLVCRVEPDHMTGLTAEQEHDASSSMAAAAARQRHVPIIIEQEDCFPNLERIGYYSSSRKGQGVHVYVLDTGIQDAHEEFEGRAVPEFQVSTVLDESVSAYVSQGEVCATSGSQTCAQDLRGHGTHVAGTVAARSYGVAPMAQVHGVKVLDDQGRGPESWILAGLDHVLGMSMSRADPAVVSMSLGMPAAQATTFSNALDRVIASGLTVVVSAGNAGEDACLWIPANVLGTITVGSSTVQDRVSAFSNWGRCVDIFAPGEDILSLEQMSTNETTEKTGTSMSAPHVSGAAALLLSASPGMPPFEVKRAIINAAQADLLWGNLNGSPNFRLSISEDGNEICDKHAGELYAQVAGASLVVLLAPLLYVAYYG